MLNGQQLIEMGIIFGQIEQENISQHGIDLNVISINKIKGPGLIPSKGKTVLGRYDNEVLDEFNVWRLSPGSYDVTFSQGCSIPADLMLLIRQRSSLLRNGAIIHSSVFDAGFTTYNIGTIMILNEPLDIEFNARIAQIYAHTVAVPVANLYDGQWQNDNQRDNQ